MPQTIQDVRAKYYHPGAGGRGEEIANLAGIWQETLVVSVGLTATKVLERLDQQRSLWSSRVRVIYHNYGPGTVWLAPSSLVSAARRNGIAILSGERLIDEWPFVHMGEVWAVADQASTLGVTVVSAL